MKTAVIYARYSSERQTEQSIEGQLSQQKRHAIGVPFLLVGIVPLSREPRSGVGSGSPRADARSVSVFGFTGVWLYGFARWRRSRIPETADRFSGMKNGYSAPFGREQPFLF